MAKKIGKEEINVVMDYSQVGIYARCSTNKQDLDRQLLELPLQLKQSDTLVETYAEKISGFKGERERPELRRLLEAVKVGKITCIMVSELTRLSRSTLHLLEIIRDLKEYKCQLIVIKDSLTILNSDGTANKTAEIMLVLLAQLGEIEAETLKIRMASGKYNKVTQNSYVGGILPYGYSYINEEKQAKKLIINESEKQVVLRIFSDFVRNAKSLRQIKSELNAENVPTKKQNLKLKNSDINVWNISTISGILSNRFYLGERKYNEEIHTLPENLIFNELLEAYQNKTIFDMANEKLTTNKSNYKPHRDNANLFTNILFCSCGEKLINKYYNKNGLKTEYYYCHSKMTTLKNDNKCTNRMIDKNILEKMIWLLIKNKSVSLKEIVTENNDNNDNEAVKETLKGQINNCNDTINLREKEIDNLIRLASKYHMSEENLESDIKKINADIQNLKKSIIAYKTQIADIVFKEQTYNVMDNVLNSLKNIESNRDLLKSYIQRIIKRIVISSDNNKNHIITVTFFNDSESYLLFNSNKTKNKFIVLDNILIPIDKTGSKLEKYNGYGSGKPCKFDFNNDSKLFNCSNENESKSISVSVTDILEVVNDTDNITALNGLSLLYRVMDISVSDINYTTLKTALSLPQTTTE